MAPFAYGGPSVSTKGGRPLATARIFSYKPVRSQAASMPGSRLARSAFMGKSVCGKCIVFSQPAALHLRQQIARLCRVDFHLNSHRFHRAEFDLIAQLGEELHLDRPPIQVALKIE